MFLISSGVYNRLMCMFDEVWKLFFLSGCLLIHSGTVFSFQCFCFFWISLSLCSSNTCFSASDDVGYHIIVRPKKLFLLVSSCLWCSVLLLCFGLS